MSTQLFPRAPTDRFTISHFKHGGSPNERGIPVRITFDLTYRNQGHAISSEAVTKILQDAFEKVSTGLIPEGELVPSSVFLIAPNKSVHLDDLAEAIDTDVNMVPIQVDYRSPVGREMGLLAVFVYIQQNRPTTDEFVYLVQRHIHDHDPGAFLEVLRGSIVDGVYTYCWERW